MLICLLSCICLFCQHLLLSQRACALGRLDVLRELICTRIPIDDEEMQRVVEDRETDKITASHLQCVEYLADIGVLKQVCLFLLIRNNRLCGNGVGAMPGFEAKVV